MSRLKFGHDVILQIHVERHSKVKISAFLKAKYMLVLQLFLKFASKNEKMRRSVHTFEAVSDILMDIYCSDMRFIL